MNQLILTKVEFLPCMWFLFTLTASSVLYFSVILFPHKYPPSHCFQDCKMSFPRERLLSLPAGFPGSNFPPGIRIFSSFFFSFFFQQRFPWLSHKNWHIHIHRKETFFLKSDLHGIKQFTPYLLAIRGVIYRFMFNKIWI